MAASQRTEYEIFIKLRGSPASCWFDLKSIQKHSYYYYYYY